MAVSTPLWLTQPCSGEDGGGDTRIGNGFNGHRSRTRHVDATWRRAWGRLSVLLLSASQTGAAVPLLTAPFVTGD